MSQDRTDALIRELIRADRAATSAETELIVRRISLAPFPSAAVHLARRMTERQWNPSTTETDYVEHLRRAARDKAARVLIYARRGGNLAAILAESERVLPPDRRGDNSLPWLFVVYSADRAIIISEYQVTSLETISLPEDVRWLR